MSNLNTRRKVAMPKDSKSVTPMTGGPGHEKGGDLLGARAERSVDGALLIRMAELLNQGSAGSGELRRRSDGSAKWHTFNPVQFVLFADGVVVNDPNSSSIRLLRDPNDVVHDLSQGYLPRCLESYGERGVPIRIDVQHALSGYLDFLPPAARAASRTTAHSAGTVRLCFPRSVSGLLNGRVPPRQAECSLPAIAGRIRRASIDPLSGGGLNAVLAEVSAVYLGDGPQNQPQTVAALLQGCSFHVMREGTWQPVGTETPLQDRDVVRCSLSAA